MPRDRSDEYYAEESFGGHVSGQRVYTGPLLLVGCGIIVGCFFMATLTQVRVVVHGVCLCVHANDGVAL